MGKNNSTASLGKYREREQATSDRLDPSLQRIGSNACAKLIQAHSTITAVARRNSLGNRKYYSRTSVSISTNETLVVRLGATLNECRELP